MLKEQALAVINLGKVELKAILPFYLAKEVIIFRFQ